MDSTISACFLPHPPHQFEPAFHFVNAVGLGFGGALEQEVVDGFFEFEFGESEVFGFQEFKQLGLRFAAVASFAKLRVGLRG